jgi:hypothetical protein
VRFLPYNKVAAEANVIVDGAATGNTVLTLSHWPKSGTPSGLKADTSTEIAFNYLDSPGLHVSADAVSNNHFDEDGLLGIFALVCPDVAQKHRRLLVDAARAGDFGVFAERQAARMAFALAAYASQESSPLPAATFNQPYPDLTGVLYVRLLELLPQMIAKLDDYRSLWETEDAKLTASEELIDAGVITIEERPDLDLAIVRLPEGLECHPFALHRRTPSSRMLVVQENRVELEYRYEGWVQMASRRPAPRVDLSPLANELNQEERAGGSWIFDGVDQITPRLHRSGGSRTSIHPETVVSRVEHYLRTGPPAWDPYD